MNFHKFYLVLLIAVGSPISVNAAPNVNGETGYMNMPDGRIEKDGTFRMGTSLGNPYSNLLWSSITLLPRVELYARYVRLNAVDISSQSGWGGYGDYKDKVASAKFLLLEEDRFVPSLVFGANDVQGTGMFAAKYLAASKQFGDLDTTIGYGNGRIDGWFAGARYAPQNWNGIALAAEYDANDYPRDKYAAQSGIDKREKGLGLALEYRYGWLGSQLAYRDGKANLNAYASVPFEVKEFIPKIHEPEPDTEVVTRPTFKQWRSDKQYQRALVKRLLEQDFKNVHLNVSEHVLEATLTNSRIALPSRAVGRAARSLLLRAPQGIREIRIHYTEKDLPFATYTFFDVERLQRYFNGFISRKELAPYVAIQFADPKQSVDNSVVLDGVEQEFYQTHLDGEEGDMISFRAQNASLSRLRVAPGMAMFFNDPSGAFRYEVFATAAMEKQLDEGLFLKAVGQLTLHENVSGVTQKSNSLLPHVRTDVAEYKQNGNLKLSRFLLNKFFQPEQRVYARASAGLYEEMFGGVGGQLLFYPQRAPWAIDVSVDALKQRDVGGRLDFRDYSTVTALASLHYRLPIRGVTATVRAGRFLAGDEGARFEFKRQFRSGFQVGAWYSLTNGNDITSPGTPANPYHDKGVFMSIPLNTMLTKDTRAAPSMSLGPWTRDVGQMVASPGDLYDVLEPAYVNMQDHDGLQYFSDADDSYALTSRANVFDDIRWSRWANDRSHVAESLTSADTWFKTGMGLGIAVLASAFDKPADRWAARHEGGRFNNAVAGIGNNLPLLVGGLAGLMVLDNSNERSYRTSFTSLEAGVAGVVASELGKYVVGRSRPKLGMGNHDFSTFDADKDSSFPSTHTTATWALLTPYAKEYDAPWLYGLAALTNAARVVDRKHWVSDTVGGALLGYAIGDALWRWHREDAPKVSVDGEGVKMTWKME